MTKGGMYGVGERCRPEEPESARGPRVLAPALHRAFSIPDDMHYPATCPCCCGRTIPNSMREFGDVAWQVRAIQPLVAALLERPPLLPPMTHTFLSTVGGTELGDNIIALIHGQRGMLYRRSIVYFTRDWRENFDVVVAAVARYDPDVAEWWYANTSEVKPDGSLVMVMTPGTDL